MLLRRLALAALSAAAALTAPLATATASATAAATPPAPGFLGDPLVRSLQTDRLTLTVGGTGDPARDGAYLLDCHPAGGTHPDAQAACDRLDEVTRWGKDPFAPVSPDTNCTMAYGGPAVAHLSGNWAGRPVNAEFNRRNGCEIARWRNLEPLLPTTAP